LTCAGLAGRSLDPFVLELDFGPFNAQFPRLTIPKSIGNGVQFLNRHLSSRLFHNPESMEPLLEFLQLHKYRGEVSSQPASSMSLSPQGMIQLQAFTWYVGIVGISVATNNTCIAYVCDCLDLCNKQRILACLACLHRFVLLWVGGWIQTLMLNDRILNLGKLGSALTKTEEYLSKLDASTPYSSFEHKYIFHCLLLHFEVGVLLLVKCCGTKLWSSLMLWKKQENLRVRDLCAWGWAWGLV
jgi:hypothetical protein